MKVIKVSEFRTNIKHYLDLCEKEPLIVTSSKGKSFVLKPIQEETIEIKEKSVPVSSLISN